MTAARLSGSLTRRRTSTPSNGLVETPARWVVVTRHGLELEEFHADADHQGDFQLSQVLAGAEPGAVTKAKVEEVSTLL
jgi:hypothetical protein